VGKEDGFRCKKRVGFGSNVITTADELIILIVPNNG